MPLPGRWAPVQQVQLQCKTNKPTHKPTRVAGPEEQQQTATNMRPPRTAHRPTQNFLVLLLTSGAISPVLHFKSTAAFSVQAPKAWPAATRQHMHPCTHKAMPAYAQPLSKFESTHIGAALTCARSCTTAGLSVSQRSDALVHEQVGCVVQHPWLLDHHDLSIIHQQPGAIGLTHVGSVVPTCRRHTQTQ